MAYLRCPECRLTAHASAYFIHGDRCPRCMTEMEPADRFRDARDGRRGDRRDRRRAGRSGAPRLTSRALSTFYPAAPCRSFPDA